MSEDLRHAVIEVPMFAVSGLALFISEDATFCFDAFVVAFAFVRASFARPEKVSCASLMG